MNIESGSSFQSLDTLMTALAIGGMAVVCAFVIVVSGIQSVAG